MRLKFFLAGVVLLLVLIISAWLVLRIVINPNDFKPQIIVAIKQQTGRDINIAGDLELQIFPQLGLLLGKTQISNPPGFDQTPFAYVDQARLQLALIPLLQGQLELDTIVIQGLIVNLQTDSLGRNNWTQWQVNTQSLPPDSSPASSKQSIPLLPLQVAGIRIDNARIQWLNQQKKQAIELNQLNVISTALVPDQPADLQLDLQFRLGGVDDLDKLNVAGELAMQTTVQWFPLDGRVIFKPLSIDWHTPVLPVALNLSSLSFDYLRQSIEGEGLTAKVLDGVITGDLQGQAIRSSPVFNGQLSVTDLPIDKLIRKLGMDVLHNTPKLSGKLKWQATPTQASMETIDLVFDESRVQGRLAVVDFAKQALDFDLNINQIDIGRYLPPSDQGRPSLGPSSATTEPDQSLPLTALRQLNMQGTLRIGSLIKDNLQLSDILMQISAKNAKLTLNTLVTLYEGQYQSKATMDVRSKLPQLTIDARLQDVQVGPLLDNQLTGKANITANLTAQGMIESTLSRTLNGYVSLRLKDGALSDLGLINQIDQGLTQLQGQPLLGNTLQNITFTQLQATANLVNGIIKNQDLQLQSPLLNIRGQGQIDLVKRDLDYRARVTVANRLNDQTHRFKQLAGLVVPITITGPIAKPDYRFDISTTIHQALENKVREKIDSKTIRGRLEEQLKKGLKSLF